MTPIRPPAHARTTSPGPYAPLLAIALLLAAIALSGCASSGALTLTSPTAASLPEDPAAQRIEKAHVVQVRLLSPHYSRRTEELPSFDIRVTNRGDAPLAFSAADVAVFSGTDPVHIYTAGELVDRIQQDAEQEGRERSGASAERILQTRSTNTDPSSAIVKIEREKVLDQSAASRATTQRRFAELVKSIVPVSIAPGGTGSGIIKLRAEHIRVARPLRIVVTLAGETYEFAFEVGRGDT